MRLNIYKVLLKGQDYGTETGKRLPITIATNDIVKIPELVNKNRVLYTTLMKEPIVGFEVTDTLYTMNMTNEQYEEEITMVDVVDEDNTQFVTRNV